MKSFVQFLLEHRYKGEKTEFKIGRGLKYRSDKDNKSLDKRFYKIHQLNNKRHIWNPDLDPMTRHNVNRSPIKNIKVSEIRASQKSLDDTHSKKIKHLRHGKDDPEGYPVVIKHNRKYIVFDGHHRINRELEKGKKRVKVRVVDISK